MPPGAPLWQWRVRRGRQQLRQTRGQYSYCPPRAFPEVLSYLLLQDLAHIAPWQGLPNEDVLGSFDATKLFAAFRLELVDVPGLVRVSINYGTDRLAPFFVRNAYYGANPERLGASK